MGAALLPGQGHRDVCTTDHVRFHQRAPRRGHRRGNITVMFQPEGLPEGRKVWRQPEPDFSAWRQRGCGQERRMSHNRRRLCDRYCGVAFSGDGSDVVRPGIPARSRAARRCPWRGAASASPITFAFADSGARQVIQARERTVWGNAHQGRVRGNGGQRVCGQLDRSRQRLEVPASMR